MRLRLPVFQNVIVESTCYQHNDDKIEYFFEGLRGVTRVEVVMRDPIELHSKVADLKSTRQGLLDAFPFTTTYSALGLRRPYMQSALVRIITAQAVREIALCSEVIVVFGIEADISGDDMVGDEAFADTMFSDSASKPLATVDFVDTIMVRTVGVCTSCPAKAATTNIK